MSIKEQFKEKMLLYKVRVNGDAEAYGELYDRYVEKIYRFVFFKINNKEETEDLTSEIFLKVWRYLIEKKEREIGSFSGLLYKVARNCLVDFYRERARRQEYALDDKTEIKDENNQQEAFHITHDAELVVEKIKFLKQEYQEILLLKYVDDLSLKEIAEILDLSHINVRVILHRATKKLKEIMEK